MRIIYLDGPLILVDPCTLISKALCGRMLGQFFISLIAIVPHDHLFLHLLLLQFTEGIS